MSDTPRTDGFDNQQQQKPDRYDWATRYSYLLDFTRELERENAALVKQRGENAKLYFEAAQVRIPELLRENAALRADKEQTVGILLRWKHVTDEWLGNIESFGYGHAEPDISCGLINDTNAAIDAARKEGRQRE